MRWYLVQEFKKHLPSLLFEDYPIKIAMVGGYSTDPELVALREFHKNSSVTYFGIDSDQPYEYVDLNNLDNHKGFDEHDIVLCSQVIEHIWNVKNFFNFLEKITKKDGYLWISCPYSNITHGSPEFFSTGYTPEFLSNNLSSNSWEFLCIERVGSKRNYYATHVFGTWLSKAELGRPVLNYEIKPGTTLGNIRKFASDLPGRLVLSLVNNKIGNNQRWCTESYVFAKKK
jgi:SAM-dependent methyltransferase